MSENRVFVSHSNLDNEFTERLVADLKAAGANVWVDYEQIASGNFAHSINEGLGKCEWVLLVQTPNALASDWVCSEIDAAVNLQHKKRIRGVIPVIAENCPPNDVPPMWDILHSYDATKDYARALKGLIRALKLNGTQPVPPPPEYQPSPAPPSLPTGNSEVGAATPPKITPTRKPKTSIQQPDKSKQRAIFLTRHVEDIAKQLEKHKQRATYQAVAGVAGIRPQRVGRCLRVLGGRCPRHSWIVNLSTGEPIGYSDSQKDRDLRINPHVISSSEELSEWLKEHS